MKTYLDDISWLRYPKSPPPDQLYIGEDTDNIYHFIALDPEIYSPEPPTKNGWMYVYKLVYNTDPPRGWGEYIEKI